jgi:hypothetical protein
LLNVWIDSALPSRTDDWYRQTGVSAPEKIGSVVRPAVKSTARGTGAGVNGVRITGAVVGFAKREAGEMSPQALRVNVPAPIPISLIKSRRVSLLMAKFSFYFAMIPV